MYITQMYIFIHIYILRISGPEIKLVLGGSAEDISQPRLVYGYVFVYYTYLYCGSAPTSGKLIAKLATRSLNFQSNII